MIKALFFLTFLLSISAVTLNAQVVRRLPMQKKKIELKPPLTWSKRVIKIDPVTQKEDQYDPNPRLEVADLKSGKYYLKWIGFDGKEKVATYQRPDCVDIVVVASTKKEPTGIYRYEYEVQSLKTSGDYLDGFAVQNFSEDISPKRPVVIENVLIGTMGPGAFGSKEGGWIRFAPIPPHPTVQPGQTIRLNLYSSSPPGIVMCRVDGGTRSIKGVGEDMPEELGSSLLGKDAWPSGFTIGPVDKLKSYSSQERAAYLLQILPQCQKQGWVISRIARTYEELLKRQDWQSIYKRISGDLKANVITTELFSIIDGLRTN